MITPGVAPCARNHEPLARMSITGSHPPIATIAVRAAVSLASATVARACSSMWRPMAPATTSSAPEAATSRRPLENVAAVSAMPSSARIDSRWRAAIGPSANANTVRATTSGGTTSTRMIDINVRRPSSALTVVTRNPCTTMRTLANASRAISTCCVRRATAAVSAPAPRTTDRSSAPRTARPTSSSRNGSTIAARRLSDWRVPHAPATTPTPSNASHAIPVAGRWRKNPWSIDVAIKRPDRNAGSAWTSDQIASHVTSRARPRNDSRRMRRTAFRSDVMPNRPVRGRGARTRRDTRDRSTALGAGRRRGPGRPRARSRGRRARPSTRAAPRSSACDRPALR